MNFDKRFLGKGSRLDLILVASLVAKIVFVFAIYELNSVQCTRALMM